jgi:hypothetical protein
MSSVLYIRWCHKGLKAKCAILCCAFAGSEEFEPEKAPFKHGDFQFGYVVLP